MQKFLIIVLTCLSIFCQAATLTGGGGSIGSSGWSGTWNGFQSPQVSLASLWQTEIQLTTLYPNTDISINVSCYSYGPLDSVEVSTKNIDGVLNSGQVFGSTFKQDRTFTYTKTNPGYFTLVVKYIKGSSVGGSGYGQINWVSYNVAPPTLFGAVYIPNGLQNSVFRVIWTFNSDYYIEYAPSVIGPWSKLYGVFGGEIDGQIMYNGVNCNYTDDRTYPGYPMMFYRSKHR